MGSVNRLYVSDLDQTLYDSHGCLSTSSREKIIRILECGIHFTIASARSCRSIEPQFKGVPLTLPIVEFNGAFVTDLASGKRLCRNTISDSEDHLLLSTARERGCYPFVSTIKGASEDRLYIPDSATNPGCQWYIDRLHRNQDPRVQNMAFTDNALRDEELVCLTFIDRLEKLTDFHEILSKTAFNQVLRIHLTENRYTPGWYWLTIYNARAHKHLAIEFLMRQCHIAEAELIVFGDDLNDLEMFKIADRSYAVENAVDEIKAAATGVIAHHTKEPVPDIIMRENGIRE